MEENRKGPGIFYAVVGVATLVVAIVGATFAYFSAQASNNTSITGTTAEAGQMVLTITDVTQTGSDLIPLNILEGTSQFADAIGTTKGASCQDSNGNNVCNVYKINIKNGAKTAQVLVRGTLNLTSTGSNMYWKLLTDATTTTEAAFSTNVKQGTTGNITVGGNVTATPGTGTEAATLTLAGDADKDFYVMVWLEETGAPQEDADSKKSYTGTVSFNAVDTAGNTGTGVTATFTA